MQKKNKLKLVWLLLTILAIIAFVMFNPFKKKTVPDSRPTAYPINFTGKGVYQESFKNSDFGVVFEDDGKTGYFYATNGKHSVIYDGIQLYNYSDNSQPTKEKPLYIVLNEPMKKAGIFYHDKFQAIYDFTNKKGGNLLNSPIFKTSEWKSPHEWNDTLTEGLNP